MQKVTRWLYQIVPAKEPIRAVKVLKIEEIFQVISINVKRWEHSLMTWKNLRGLKLWPSVYWLPDLLVGQAQVQCLATSDVSLALVLGPCLSLRTDPQVLGLDTQVLGLDTQVLGLDTKVLGLGLGLETQVLGKFQGPRTCVKDLCLDNSSSSRFLFFTFQYWKIG